MSTTKKHEFSLNEVFSRIGVGLKQSAQRPNIYGYSPHEKQELFHSASGKHRLYIGGNRAGKTVGGTVEDIWWLTGRHPYRETPPPPVRGRIVGVDFLNGIEKILRPEMARWLPLSELKGGSWSSAYSKSERVLTLENGSTVEYMSYDQDLDKFAGTSRHFVHFDEEPPQDIFIECSMRLIDTGGSWWMTMTPVEGMTWIFDDIYLPGVEGTNSLISVIQVDMSENPHLSQGEIDNFMLGLSDEERIARKQGKFVQLGGLVFKHFSPDIHVIDPIIPPKEWQWFESMDHGYNNPTAHLWHAVSSDDQVITFGEHYEAEQTVDYHAQIVHARNAQYGKVPEIFVADPAISQRQAVTGTSIHEEYARRGLAYVLGNNDVSVGINRMAQYLKPGVDGQPRWLITRNCVNLVREMQRLRWKTWATKKMANQNNKYDTIHKKDDHAPDSARYFFSLMPDLTPNNFEPAKLNPGIYGVTGVDPTNSYDTILSRLQEPVPLIEGTSWRYNQIDEFMGGEW